MAKKEDRREQLLDRAVAFVLREGLARTSLRDLARAAEVSDRMLLYYFKDKDDLLTSILERSALELAAILGAATDDTRRSPREIFALTIELTRNDPLRPYMRLWTQIAAAATSGQQPYARVASTIVYGLLAWVSDRLALDNDGDRKKVAAQILGMVEGVAVLDGFTDGRLSTMAAEAMADSLC